MPSKKGYCNVALSEETYYKVLTWAHARETSLGEAVSWAFDNLGVPDEKLPEPGV